MGGRATAFTPFYSIDVKETQAQHQHPNTGSSPSPHAASPSAGLQGRGQSDPEQGGPLSTLDPPLDLTGLTLQTFPFLLEQNPDSLRSPAGWPSLRPLLLHRRLQGPPPSPLGALCAPCASPSNSPGLSSEDLASKRPSQKELPDTLRPPPSHSQDGMIYDC